MEYDANEPILTAREKEIVNLLSIGNTNRQISAMLGISVHTVERHRANVLAKLGLHSTAGLIKYGIEHGEAARSGQQLRGDNS